MRAAFGNEQNWAALLSALEWHGLVPLAARRVSAAAFDVPASVRRALRARRHAIAGINLFLARELERVTDALGAERVNALPFKGPSLAMAAFGDVSLRQFSDLDIIVAERQLPAAIGVLEAAGYELKPGFRLTAAETRLYLRQGYHLPLRHRDHGTELELHWQVAGGAYRVFVSFEELWERRTEVVLGSRPMPALCAEDHLLLLVINAAKEMWDRVSRVADCAGLLSRCSDFDWERTTKRARTMGAERMLLLGTHLAATHLAAPLPAQIRRRCENDPGVANVSARLPRVWHEQISCDDARATSHAFYGRCLDFSSQRFSYALLLLLQPSLNDVRAFRLPAAWYFLAWFLRPFRLLAQPLGPSRKTAQSGKVAKFSGTYANPCTGTNAAAVDTGPPPTKVVSADP